MERNCDACGELFAAKPRTRYCDGVECKRRRARSRKNKERTGEVIPLPSRDPVVVSSGVTAVTVAELEAAGRVQTSAGQNAILLAQRLDAALFDTGSSVAALSKQHLAAVAEAVKDAPQAGDEVDELTQRRRLRRA